ncbi:heavy metal-associated isoprenylated plant protein 7-like isoform X1 [Cucurbita maxima]|uniref:Heavy metal-associated isoprenylated plant protein 7-like isoform X1 n=1 Tax=Cucurbita maxima TaxID=3661 RepID=A0A6J1KP38_CUCMA|nr:heavy metal-associated isoprenylated plant protein 7-like isoform X1 [Cucurbita maxima]
MGEEIKRKEEGEDQKKEETKQDKQEPTESAAAAGTEKKQDTKKNEEEPPSEIVLKVDMHCEACARKVARALKGFQGVENVTTDSRAGKVVVKGKEADPLKVCQRLQKKSGRKVELISPLPKPPEQQPKEDEKQPKEEKKEEATPPPPPVVTVVLQVQMHCEACAQGLRKRIRKIKGVESVETELSNNRVIVKGVMDATTLVNEVSKRTRKPASIVVKEEEKKEEEKKEEEKPATEEKPEEKKETQEEDDKKFDIKRFEHWPTKHYTEYAYYYPERIFSDENPNGCSIM